MKTSLKIAAITLLAILLSLNGFCQLPTLKATSQGWAGGVCCRTGTNYHVTLTGKKGTLDDFKIGSVCIGGLQFDATQINVQSTTVDDKTIIYLNMGVSHDEANELPDNTIKTKYVQPTCSDMQVSYSTGWKKLTLIITEVEQLEFIAYP